MLEEAFGWGEGGRIVVEGIVVEGIVVEGIVVEGIVVEGIVVEGIVVEGIADRIVAGYTAQEGGQHAGCKVEARQCWSPRQARSGPAAVRRAGCREEGHRQLLAGSAARCISPVKRLLGMFEA